MRRTKFVPTNTVVRALVFARLSALAVFTLLPGADAPQTTLRAQTISGFERDRGRLMLKIIKDDLKKHYYDPAFRGMDVDARFKEAEDKIKEAVSNGQVFRIIARLLLDLNDSHTFFLPPSRSARSDYGWQMQMIGDACYVAAVKPGSDAEAKSLKVGDRVLSVNGFQPTRDNMWQLHYLYYTLQPQAGLRVTVQSPGGQPREMDVMAKVRQGKKMLDLTSGSGIDMYELMREAESEDRLHRHRFHEVGDDLLIWKMPQFDLMEKEVDDYMGRAKKRKALILDLRGNGGGYVLTLQRLAGHFFEREVKIADLKGRKEMKPLNAKPRGGGEVFKGKLVVLVDSQSGSASELFARVVQLEKRGVIIGDRSAGAVMRSRHYGHAVGTDTMVFYGTSITDADLIMTDGKSLERVGVAPDVLMLPRAEDLTAKRDPVLAHAASLVGVNLDAAKAGALFPVEWLK